jgi:hypothetical protein
MTIQSSPHPWSKESLFAKALLYVDAMQKADVDDWHYGFWSALSLELLARAALAHFSPTFLAEEKNWRNISYALGNESMQKNFSPSSIGIGEVFKRLSELETSFNQDTVGFCLQHINRRNVELHTGDAAFLSIGTSQWLPKYYETCEILLKIIGKELSHYFEDPITASQMIESLNDNAAKEIRVEISSYAQVWKNKNDVEKITSVGQAEIWSTKHAGHRIKCPACASAALLRGTPTGIVITKIHDNEVKQSQKMIPSTFECIACGLRISGFSKLRACDLGNSFTATSLITAAEYFELYTEDDIETARREGAESSWEPDFNE